MAATIKVGDCVDVLAGMERESVHCVVTSPPYWGLRAYKGDTGMIGLEPTFDEHLENLVGVFREVRRVLRSDGTLWLNYGDAYAASGRAAGGLKAKDLMMMPARVALALQADGWWLRSEIVWRKPNPIPESVKDRPTSSHEKLFLMSKSARYFYDAEAIRAEARAKGLTANLRNVWSIATQSFRQAHFATFPEALVKPCIKAGTSEKGVCEVCGAPWVRDVEIKDPKGRLGKGYHEHNDDLGRGQRGVPSASGAPVRKTMGWLPSCDHDETTVPSIVLDPFGGSGTVSIVAGKLHRDSILIEINPEYAEMSRKRINGDQGLFADIKLTTKKKKATTKKEKCSDEERQMDLF